MAVPETDLARIRRLCEKQAPPEMCEQVRVEHRVRGRTGDDRRASATV